MVAVRVHAQEHIKQFIEHEVSRLFASVFSLDVRIAGVEQGAGEQSAVKQNTGGQEADLEFVSTAQGEQQSQYLPEDSIAITLSHGKLHVEANRDGALLIALYRLMWEFGARFPEPGREILPHLAEQDFANAEISVQETASYAHRGVCIEGADDLQTIINFVDWLPKIGMNSFFIQFENVYSFLKRWYEHEFNPYLEKEPFSTDIALAMSDNIADEMRKRGIVHHRVGHGWTGEVLGYSSKFGWEKGLALPEEKKPFVALVDGKRDLIDGTPIFTSIDFANQEVNDAMVQCIVDYAREHRDVDYLHVWLSDAANNICECDECKQTTPSDQYVKLMNQLDEALTEAQLDTKICFLLYHELLFAPQTETIHNPSRFTMMFAPISRSFESSYADVNYPDDIPQMKPYVRNEFTKPHDLVENLASLKAWQQVFDGDSFVYDYPLGRAHYGDAGYMAIASIIYHDIQSLDQLGLRGYIACQELRAGFPTYFPNYVMSRMLWNSSAQYDDIVQEYFESGFGERWQEAVQWLQSLSEHSSCDYFNGIGERHDATKVVMYEQLVKIADGAVPMIEQGIVATHGAVRENWMMLSYFRQYIELIGKALAAQAGGADEQAHVYWSQCLDYVRRSEPQIRHRLDVYRLIEVSKNYAGFKVDIEN